MTTKDQALERIDAALSERQRALKDLLRTHRSASDRDLNAAINRLCRAQQAYTAAERVRRAIVTGTPQRFPKPERVK
jgi:hypothetical protein